MGSGECLKPCSALQRCTDSGDLEGLRTLVVEILDLTAYSLAQQGMSDMSVSVFQTGIQLGKLLDRAVDRYRGRTCGETARMRQSGALTAPAPQRQLCFAFD